MLDLTNKMKDVLFHRVSSPIFSSFLISWLVCNYRIVILFFSSLEPRYKIYEIELLTSKEDAYWQLYLIPLIFALFYATAFPFIESYIYKIWLAGNRRLMEAKAESDGKTSLSQEQVNELRQELYDYRSKYLTLIDSNELQIKTLKAELLAQSDNHNNFIKSLRTSLTDDLSSKHKTDIEQRVSDYDKLKSSFDLKVSEIERLKSDHEGLKNKISFIARINKNFDLLNLRILDKLVNAKSYTLVKEELLGQYKGDEKFKVDKAIRELIIEGCVKSGINIYNEDVLVLTDMGKEFYQKEMDTPPAPVNGYTSPA